MDKVEYYGRPSYYRIKDIVKTRHEKKIAVSINGRDFEIENEGMEIIMNNKKVSADEFIINGADIRIKEMEGSAVLSSIFRVYPIDTSAIKGKMVEFAVDGEKAGYMTPIRDGSKIEIKFI